MTSIDAELMAAKKEFCVICFDDDLDSDLMCLVDECGHRFCSNCVKQHIEVKLIDRMIPNCLAHRCESQLPIDRCDKLLTLKLSLMWGQKIKEDSTPLPERVYCPYQSCSYLMSKTELFSSVEYSGLRRCFKCYRSFCLHCKVPWHSALSCNDYKNLHRNPQNDDDHHDEVKLKALANLRGWHQCSKCQYMIERSYGCNYMACRCGNVFCYECGAKWNSSSHFHQCVINNEVPQAISPVALFGVTSVVVFISYQFSVCLRARL